MQIELSATEHRTIVAALTVYRRVKGAEGKLASQKQKDLTLRAETEARYMRLTTIVEALLKRL